MVEEATKEPLAYTVFNLKQALMLEGAEARDGTIVYQEYLAMPNNPRVSLDGSIAIATGIYDSPECKHITQSEAEKLMQTKEWSDDTEVH